jgi:hypothetical protein
MFHVKHFIGMKKILSDKEREKTFLQDELIYNLMEKCFT